MWEMNKRCPISTLQDEEHNREDGAPLGLHVLLLLLLSCLFFPSFTTRRPPPRRLLIMGNRCFARPAL